MASSRQSFRDNNCTGGELVVGTARGRRAFHLGPDGWLRGVTYRVPWQPGENVAQCMVTELVSGFHYSNHPANRSIGGWIFRDGEPQPQLAEGYQTTQCKGLEANCTCGFYAYHSGHETYAVSTLEGIRVEGIVEAYGKLILGPLGYRAEKARIVAVTLPLRDQTEERVHRLQRLLDEAKEDYINLLTKGRLMPTLGQIALCVTAVGLCAAGAALPDLPVWLRYASAFAAGALGILGAAIKGTYNADVAKQVQELVHYSAQLRGQLAWMLSEAKNTVTPLMAEEVKAHYPGIDVFDNRDAMLAAYPVEPLGHLADDDGSAV